MTERQARVLEAIVEHYIKTAAPVGSLALSRDFGLSSATIRSEMSALEEDGYITHPHTSAGRTPTDKGYRHYVDSLEFDAESDARRVEQVIEKRIGSAGEPDQAVRLAVDSLSEITHNLGISAMGDHMYVHGLASLLAQPEFRSSRRVHEVARLLDNLEPWLRETAPRERVNVYIGRENPVGKASGASLIVSRFRSPYSDYSYIGVVGPTRQSYPEVMRLVGYTSKMLEEANYG